MEVYRKSSWLLFLLGVSLLATALQGVQGEVESEGPSESECRPYIEKALKELETGEAGEILSPDPNAGDSKEDIPTVEITTDDSSHQVDTDNDSHDGDGDDDVHDDSKEAEDSSKPESVENDTAEADISKQEEIEQSIEKVSEEKVHFLNSLVAKISSFFNAINKQDKSQEAVRPYNYRIVEPDDDSKESHDTKEQTAKDDSKEVGDSKEADTPSKEGDEHSKEDEGQSKEDDTPSKEDDTDSKEAVAHQQEVPSQEDGKESVEEAADTKEDSKEDDKDSKEGDTSTQAESEEDDKTKSVEELADSGEHKEESQEQKDDESKEQDQKPIPPNYNYRIPVSEEDSAEKAESVEQKEDKPKEKAQEPIPPNYNYRIPVSEEESAEKAESVEEKDDKPKEKVPDTIPPNYNYRIPVSEEESAEKAESVEQKDEKPKEKAPDAIPPNYNYRIPVSEEDSAEKAKSVEQKDDKPKGKAPESIPPNYNYRIPVSEEESVEKMESVEKTESVEQKDDKPKGKVPESIPPNYNYRIPVSEEESTEKAKSVEQKEDKPKEKAQEPTKPYNYRIPVSEEDKESAEDKKDEKPARTVKRSIQDDSKEDSKEGSEEDGEAPEEELIMDIEIPSELRPRDHVERLLKLDSESSDIEEIINKVSEITLRELQKLYENAIKPLEVLYKYRDLSNRHFGDAEIFSKPLILFMGPWSGGKSSIINYLINNEYNETSLRTGAEPSPAYFNILMHGDEIEVLDGTELAADYTFSGLQKFGQGLEERLRGLKLPSKLLEKVNIVEIPGILEVRKQVSRVFPFNDACQWFIDRADIIFLVYDPSKLDVGPETEAILDQLKGREHQTRIILNKADQVKPEELMRVQSALIWNISPLMSSPQPPVMYTTSLWSRPYESWAPVRLLQAQERAFLRDLRGAIDKRIENKIASARRFAVRVRNHAKMVDCYLTTYYNHKSVFGNRKQVADEIIEHPQDYHIYEGLSTLTNISRYDLPDPDVYRDFFKLNPLYEFQQLSATCTYFRGCPIHRLDVAIAYDLPELVRTHKKLVEGALADSNPSTKSPPAS